MKYLKLIFFIHIQMKGTVYKIEVGEDIYVGSTILKLCRRQGEHNFYLKKIKNKIKLYQECIKNNIDKIICIPLETKEIENDFEIRELEQKYIEELNPSLNQYSAYTGLTKKEYNKQWIYNNKERKKEYDKEYRKEYRKKNKEKIKEQKKQKITCPICNKIVCKNSLIRHKQSKKCLSMK